MSLENSEKVLFYAAGVFCTRYGYNLSPLCHDGVHPKPEGAQLLVTQLRTYFHTVALPKLRDSFTVVELLSFQYANIPQIAYMLCLDSLLWS